MSESLDDGERLVLTRVISKSRPGPELDRLVAMLLFDIQSEPCDSQEGFYHLKGSSHHQSKVDKSVICISPLPAFSSDWSHFKVVVEWLTNMFSGLEILWDCGRWGCNVNGSDTEGRWFRLSNSAGSSGMQEAVCKAALLSVVNPQALPLEFRSKIIAKPVIRTFKKNLNRKKSK